MNGQAIVFDQETGTPVRVEFLNNEWWVVSKNSSIIPLSEFTKEPVVLTTDNRLELRNCLMMLGCVLQCYEHSPRFQLENRMDDLKLLGVEVTSDWLIRLKAQVMKKHNGEYGLMLEDITANRFGCAFAKIDRFEEVHDAVEYARQFVDFLRDECWGKVELEFELPKNN